SAMAPAVAETGIGFDRVEFRIEVAEFLPDALHHGAHIRPVAIRSLAGLKPDAADRVVDLAIADIAAGALGQQLHHLELAMGQLDLAAVPGRARRGDVEHQSARAALRHRAVTRLLARQGDAQPLQDDGEALAL